MKKGVGRVVDSASSMAGEAAEVGAEALGASAKATRKALDASVNAAKKAVNATTRAGTRAVQKSIGPGKEAVESTVDIGRTARDAASGIEGVAKALDPRRFLSNSNGMMTIGDAMLASELYRSVNNLLLDIPAKTVTTYDKILDANYSQGWWEKKGDESVFHQPREGGIFHRSTDGSHTVAGAFKAVFGEAPEGMLKEIENDSTLEKVAGTLGALFKDMSTPMGLPLFTWDKAFLDRTVEYLETLGITKSWVTDMSSVDTSELIGPTIGSIVIVFRWNEREAGEFAKLGAAFATSAAVGANPLLLIVSLVCLAKSFHLARHGDEMGEVFDEMFRGSFTSGTTILAVNTFIDQSKELIKESGTQGVAESLGAVGDLAVPGTGVIVGMVVGSVAHQLGGKVSITEVSEFASERTVELVNVLRANAERSSGLLENAPTLKTG